MHLGGSGYLLKRLMFKYAARGLSYGLDPVTVLFAPRDREPEWENALKRIVENSKWKHFKY